MHGPRTLKHHKIYPGPVPPPQQQHGIFMQYNQPIEVNHHSKLVAVKLDCGLEDALRYLNEFTDACDSETTDCHVVVVGGGHPAGSCRFSKILERFSKINK